MTKKPECKTKCGKPSTVEGWCTVCYSKFKRGYFTASGSLSPEVIKQQKEKAEKAAKKAARLAQKRHEFLKEELGSRLNSSHLKILADQVPESTQQHYCEALSFWTSDTVCYSRLFISKNKKCAKCKVHNDKLESLHTFMENCNGKESTETAKSEIEAANEATGEPARGENTSAS